MDPITLGIGILAIAFGIFSGVMHFVKPRIFKKLEAMKEKFGDRMGGAMHFISYVILPFIFGVVILISGYIGIPFFEATQ